MSYLRAILLVSMIMGSLWAGVKRYDVRSGIVEYAISGSGSIMGIANTIKGHSKTLFDDYGNIELQEEWSTSTTMGHTTKSHRLTKFVGGSVYSVDFARKKIVKMDPAALQGKKDLQQVGKGMLRKMDGKVIGRGKVLGYDCEIWSYNMGKIWLYKGVPLKIESHVMGIVHHQIATKAKFGVSIPKSAFKLPPYPVQTLNQMIREETKGGTSAQKMPPAAMPQIDQKQLQQMMQNLGKMFGTGK